MNAASLLSFTSGGTALFVAGFVLFRNPHSFVHRVLAALLVFAAMVVLALFLLSDRLRLRQKRFISRHFKRPRYDYPRVWARFTETTASLSDMPTLCGNIVRMVSETLESLSVSIWLLDEQEDRLFSRRLDRILRNAGGQFADHRGRGERPDPGLAPAGLAP